MSASIEFIELRKEPRVVSHRTVVRVAGDDANRLDARHEGVLVDHGPNGAGLLVNKPYTLNRVVTLEGFHAGVRTASVRWVRRARSHYRIGVEFVGV